MEKEELKEKIESLEIQLRHLENDYILTKEENEESIEKYIEILSELKEKNQKLQNLQENLEKIVEARTKELKESQKFLQEKGEELQIILDSSPAMIFYKDKQNRFMRVNKSFANVVGMPINSIIGKADYEIFPGKTEQQINDELEIIKTGKPKLDVSEYIETSNGRIWIQVDKIPYNDTDGNIIGIIGFALDITDRKRSEEEKRELEEQLFQAQKMESIGRLAGGIAHDFNNLLASIIGYAELLKMKLKDADKKEKKAIDSILKGSESAANLVKQLLGFARKGKFNPVIFNTNDVIKDTVKVCENIFEKNIKVRYKLDEKIKNIEGDKNQLEQVFTNLIINAKDSMPDGGELIFKTKNIYLDEKYVSKHIDFKSGNYIKVLVTDTGAGMSKEVQENIFEPFFTTKEEGKGTGLGLATVYGIIKNHNGHIDCNSEPGLGTTFTVFLPVAEGKIIEEENDTSIIKGEETILVIDDEDSVRDITKEQLETLGYKVLVASSGIEGLDIYKRDFDKIDLILLDMIMPKMTGKEILDAFRKIKVDAKVVLMSGFSQDNKSAEILQKGTIGFLQKPFMLPELSKVVFKSLKK